MKTPWLALFCLLLALDATPLHAQAAPTAPPTRAAFAAAMRKVKAGMSAAAVVKLLGKPDDISTDGGMDLSKNPEIWSYGSNGPHTFATLGTVFMDGGKVQQASNDSASPPDPGMFTEPELRQLLRLIASVYSDGGVNPLRYIQIVNALQPLGKKKALAVISEFYRVADSYPGGLDENLQMFLILRLLFQVPPDPGYMPVMYLGAPDPAAPSDPKVLPLFPLALVNDIPLDLVIGYELEGFPQQASDHIEYFRKFGKLREHPLRPSDNPLAVLDLLEHSPQWIYPGKPGDDALTHYDWGKKYIASQLLQLVDTVYREPGDPKNIMDVPFDPQRWDKIVKDVAALNIHWDAAKNIYVLADGTTLPPLEKPVYAKSRWREIPGLGARSELTIVRTGKRDIFISLSCNGPGVKSILRVYRTAAGGAMLAEFPIPAVADKNSFQLMSGSVDLAAGETVQGEITSGTNTAKSEVFNP